MDFFNKSTFDKMKETSETSIFMNIGRGTCVNEEDLVAALLERDARRARRAVLSHQTHADGLGVRRVEVLANRVDGVLAHEPGVARGRADHAQQSAQRLQQDTGALVVAGGGWSISRT